MTHPAAMNGSLIGPPGVRRRASETASAAGRLPATPLLDRVASPADLRNLPADQLPQLAREMRTALCEPLFERPAHFASNLGVVELAIALHLEFDLDRDHVVWDTGHQVYPHKLLTGRRGGIAGIRSRGGLMGYPNPAESAYDEFMTGHAGCSLSTALGLKAGDVLRGAGGRHSIAVIGDGAFPSGIVFEAMNNAAGLGHDLIVILNDNGMSICPNVGGLTKTLAKARSSRTLGEIKTQLDALAGREYPLVGASVDRLWRAAKDVVKANVFGGMLFEEFGFNYMGPVDGHDLDALRRALVLARDQKKGPVLIHAHTGKGHGIDCAAADPVTFHTPPTFRSADLDAGAIELVAKKGRAFTNVVSDAIHARIAADKDVAVITAAMCQGNKLAKIRDEFPEQFFDVGICESHGVAFAAGMAKAGARPIVAIYSTFLQRSFDQIFQEVALQNLPVTFCLDRAGFTGPDGPTHHGNYDIPYMRMLPNMVVMAPGDENDVAPMLDFALRHDAPCSIRYPKETPADIDRAVQPVALGESETLEWGADGCLIAFGSVLDQAMQAADRLRDEGLDVGVVNARFAKPLDTATILRAVTELPFVVTLEEGTLHGGFGSAVLEACNDAGVSAAHVHRIGVPDRFVMHAERSEQYAEIGLDVAGIVAKVHEAAGRTEEAVV